MHGSHTEGHFVPALGRAWLTPLYDSVAWLTGETYFKRALIEASQIRDGMRVLDLGCGTGTLALMVAEAHPGAEVTGMDIDPEILRIAQDKADKAGRAVTLRQGSAAAPPFEPQSFDRILTTLMLHHLPTEQKRAALAASLALLAPGGELHIADFGKPHTLWTEIAAAGVRWLDGHDSLGVNLRGELPAMVRDAGFEGVEQGENWSTLFGTLVFIRARKPA